MMVTLYLLLIVFFFFFMYERTAVSMHFSVLYANTQSIKQERRQTFF